MTQREFLSEKIGRNLKKFIKASKFKTQERFAFEGMNVNPSTVRRWISGGIKDINTVEEISIVLEINFEELLKWSSFLVQFLYYFIVLKKYIIYMCFLKGVIY